MVFLGIDWGKLSKLSFWLEVSPGELSSLFEKYFLGILAINYLIYLASFLYRRKLIAKKSFIMARFIEKIGNFTLSMAVSFTFIFFFRYEAIPVLGGRFWVLIWIIVAVIWLISLIRYYFIKIPQQRRELEERLKRNKYIISSKKK
jgi:hypothetical protein